MSATLNVSAARLRALLSYDAETGDFRWLVNRTSNKVAGKLAGSIDNGYLRIGVDGRSYRAHRLAWLHTHGTWPMFCVDHIDGVKTNNCLANLRDVTHNINMQNQKRAQTNTESGILGVYPEGIRWKAVISIHGKQTHLGTFDTPEQASTEYIAAKRLHHPGNTL